ncbi:unnamed protein product [Sphagnum jensenii]|uniref:Ribosomal protein S21 n=1 Tax=Sphagnum jensenii TaxID=128206 RepID=A0ABP0VSP6_9BRYO
MAAAARIRAFFQVWKRQMRGVCVGGPTVAAIPASNSLHSVKFSSTAVSNSSSFLHCHGITAPAFLRVWQQQLLVHHLHREEEDAAYNNKSACSMHPRSGRRGISEQQELLGFESSNKSLFWNPWRPKQVRHIMVEVVNDDLERAIRKLMRRLRDDGCIRRLRSRQYYQKPSELKVLARKERDKRIQRKAFRKKLNWIMERRKRSPP